MDTKKLVSSCQKAMLKNEYKTSTIRGVRNLSRSDLETAILYAQHAQKYGSWEGTLMPPHGNVAELPAKFQ